MKKRMILWISSLCMIALLFSREGYSQQESCFEMPVPFDSMGIRLYDLYTTREGVTHFTSSIGIWKLKGHMFDGPSVGTGILYDSSGKPGNHKVKLRNYLAEDSIRSMAQGPDGIFYFVTHYNFFIWRPNGEVGGWGWPPFNFPKTSPVTKIWIDNSSTLFVGTRKDNFYFIEGAGSKDPSWRDIDFGADDDSNYIVTKNGKMVKQVVIQPGVGVYSFAQDNADTNMVWIGTNRGLFTYNKRTGKINSIEQVNRTPVTVTEIYTGEEGNVWFSTMEKGLALYRLQYGTCHFYPYKKRKVDLNTKFPVKTFCYKSPNQFFVAVLDSLPAIFDTQSRNYQFLDDSILRLTRNETSDVKVDKLGNLFLIKGGQLYLCNASKNTLLRTSVIADSTLLAPFFRRIQLLDGQEVGNLDLHPELLKRVVLEHDQNSLIIYYDVIDYSDKNDIQFAWKVDGYTHGWVEMPRFNLDSGTFAYLQHLRPGSYLLQVKVKVGSDNWRTQIAQMEIIIKPPFWARWWFWTALIGILTFLVFMIVKMRERSVRKQERLKVAHEKELLELEARALRAQMNPHFIFNCMNSIKSLIQMKEEEKAVQYLTTFSKLIRTIFQNSDKREVSLFDEIETCKLYTQLEGMRFGKKLTCVYNIEESIDLKSIRVPALIIQPFIENAIWHGIMPKEEGGTLIVTVKNNYEFVYSVIDDDGIGREMSQQNKFGPDQNMHQSKGVHLTQNRLSLDKKLNQRNAVVETSDKKDDLGNPSGTKVTFKFSQY